MPTADQISCARACPRTREDKKREDEVGKPPSVERYGTVSRPVVQSVNPVQRRAFTFSHPIPSPVLWPAGQSSALPDRAYRAQDRVHYRT